MTRRASPTLIGLFVMGGLVLVVGALLVLGGREWFTRRVTCVMAFDGSVAGLAVGSPVRFRGVPVGAVSNIEFRYGSSLIVVFAQFAPSRIRGAPPLPGLARRSRRMSRRGCGPSSSCRAWSRASSTWASTTIPGRRAR